MSWVWGMVKNDGVKVNKEEESTICHVLRAQPQSQADRAMVLGESLNLYELQCPVL